MKMDASEEYESKFPMGGGKAGRERKGRKGKERKEKERIGK